MTIASIIQYYKECAVLLVIVGPNVIANSVCYICVLLLGFIL